MSTKDNPNFNPYAYRKAPKDIDFHYIINEVKYVEEIMDKGILAYDDRLYSTINLLARYFRNYKQFEKPICETIIYNYITDYFMRTYGTDLPSETGRFMRKISQACSLRRYKDCHGYKPLRDFDGVWITRNEIEAIKELSGEEQQVLFAALCFTKMYNEQNRRQGRKINNLFYVSDSVLRRVLGWKRGTVDQIPYVINKLAEKGYMGYIENFDKYALLTGQYNRQPLITPQCLIVDDESEQVLFIDNFDTLHLTLCFILGDKRVKKCECGRYFEVKSNRQKSCPKCSPPRKRKSKKRKTNGLKKRPQHQ